MSRIGKRLIAIPDGVTVNLDGQQIAAKGPKGELSIVLVKEVTAEVGDDGITIGPKEDSKRARSMWGLTRSLVSNVITGVTEGFTKTLEINGVGYRAQVQGKNLQLTLGLSHDVAYAIPDGIKIECTKPTEIVVSGIERQKVGQVAAEIRRYRPPEPYKGKGIRYAGEYVFRKEGKKK